MLEFGWRRGGVPLIDLRRQCTKGGSRRTDWVVAARHTGPRTSISGSTTQADRPDMLVNNTSS
jgi:hypothetical protein